MLKICKILLRVLLVLLAVCGIWIFLIPIPLGIRNIGNMVGLFACVLLFGIAVFKRPISRFLKFLWRKKPGRITLISLGSFFVLGVTLCVVLSCMMLGAIHKRPETPPDAMVVLGCQVRGTRPSLMLRKRLDCAYEMLNEYPEMICVVSGGKGPDEGISEAQCMFNWLTEQGIAPERILMEDRSASTSENLRFSREILQQNQIDDRIMIATDGFHQLRAHFLAKKEGFDTCYAAPANTSWYLLPTYWVREWFGLVHAFVFGR